MTYKSLTLDISHKVAHIKLNRPEKLNTMNTDFWLEFPKLIKQLNDDAAARVIVISSTGKHFTAGMDLDVFTNGSLSQEAETGRKNENLRQRLLQLQETFNLLEKIRIPVLVATQGGCIGGGVDMISACDSRYCTEDAFFSIEEIKLGMAADLGTLQRLPHLIPQGLIRELAYTGRRLMAFEANEAGLVNKVFADQQSMLTYVMDIAKQIATNSPLAVAGCKEMINYARDHSVSESINAMSIWQSGMFQPQNDMMETFIAKKEKRAPEFDELCKIEPPIQGN